MAKITPGVAVSQISGSVGGTTFSRNRGGMYMRNRSIPIVSTTLPAQAAKNRLAAESIAWQSLTQAQRDAWKHYAEQNPVIDTLGAQRQLSAHQSFVKLNTRIALVGETRITDPPIVAAPDALLTVTLTADIGTGDVEVAFTTTPLGTGIGLYLFGDVVDSPGINYVQNTLRFIMASTAAQASPLNIETEATAVFGTLVVGQTFHLSAHTIRLADGQISTPLKDRAVVIST